MARSINRPRRPWELPRRNFNKMQGQGRQSMARFYKSQEWKKARLAHLQLFPFCIICEENGKLVFANTVDHKIPINPTDPYDTQDG